MKNSKPMSPDEIKKALEDAEISQAGLARDLSVSRSTIHQVIHNDATSHRVRCHIAKAIKRPVGVIWPIKNKPSKPGRPLTNGLFNRPAA